MDPGKSCRQVTTPTLRAVSAHLVLTFLVGNRPYLETLAQQMYHALGIWHTKQHNCCVGCKSAKSACADES